MTPATRSRTVTRRERPLLIVGAGGLARETAEAVRTCGDRDLLGYLDDDPDRLGTVVDGLPVLGPSTIAADRPEAQIVLCPGSGGVRARIAERLAGLGISDDRYATIVHPSASVPASCSLGAGTILLAGVVLTASVSIGRHVPVMPNAVLTHDDVLDDFVTVCAGVALAGNVRVGTGAYLGAGSLVRERVTVGAWSTLGMGAVVIGDVGRGEVWAGNPARYLRPA